MNNVWYPFVEMADDNELKTMRTELRMSAHATSGGVSKLKFEAYALAASIVGKCHFCVKAHHELLKQEGMSTQQLRDIGRIAAVWSTRPPRCWRRKPEHAPGSPSHRAASLIYRTAL